MSEAELLKHLNKPNPKYTKFTTEKCETSFLFGKSDLQKSLFLSRIFLSMTACTFWVLWLRIWQFAQMMLQKKESVWKRSRSFLKYLCLQYQNSVQELMRLTSTAVREADSILKSQLYQYPMSYAVEMIEKLGLWGYLISRELNNDNFSVTKQKQKIYLIVDYQMPTPT